MVSPVIGSDYIGELGRLLRVRWNSELSVSGDSSSIHVDESPERRWVFASPSSGRREWSASFVGRNQDLNNILALARSTPPAGGFIYVPDVASFTNVLTPAQSMLSGFQTSSIADAEGNLSLYALVGSPASAVVADKVPVIPGAPVTVSVDVAGDAQVLVEFMGANGNRVYQKSGSTTGSLMQRVSVSLESVPVTARYVRVTVSGFLALTNPQVTWTAGPVPYAPGMGCGACVISDVQYSIRRQIRRDGDTRWDVQVSISEVG